MNVNAAIEKFLDDRKARNSNTAEAYGIAMAYLRKALTINGVEPSMADIVSLRSEWTSWMVDTLRHLAPASEHLYAAGYTAFVRFSWDRGWCAVPPERVKSTLKSLLRRVDFTPPALPEEKVDQFLAWVEGLDTQVGVRDCAMITLMAHTGLRRAEIERLKWTDIDFASASGNVLAKGGKIRRFHMSATCAARMWTWKVRCSSAVRVFPMASRTINETLEKRVLECFGRGHPRITPHTLRHYFVTRFLRHTHDIRMTQQAVGHRNINTTARYAHILDDEIQEAVEGAFK